MRRRAGCISTTGASGWGLTFRPKKPMKLMTCSGIYMMNRLNRRTVLAGLSARRNHRGAAAPRLCADH